MNAGGRGAIGGATTGAGFGTMVMPGIGTGIGAGIGALIGWLSGRKKDKHDKLSPEIKRLLEMQMQRMQSQQPLRDSVQQMAFNRMPAIYRQGMQVPGQTALPRPTGDPMRDLIAMQAAQQQGQQPLYDVLQHLAQSRMQGVR